MKLTGGMALAVVLSGMMASGAAGSLLHHEALHGDLSGDRLNPTSYDLVAGTNKLIATSNTGDREYVNLSVPTDGDLVAVNLTLFTAVGTDQIAFVAVQAGTTFTEPPTGTNVGNLLGWTHFGPGVGNLGMDILPAIGMGPGSMGFTPPLTGNEYTWWIQQTGPNLVTYELDFVVTPEPTSLAILGLGGLVALRRTRRS